MTEDCECRKKPEPSKCWPNDPDYLDGKTEIELPSERFTKAFWDADILDLDDKNRQDTILGTQELFKVRFRVELHGRLWKCMTGDWYFDVGFTPSGAAQFDLRCCDGHIAIAGYEAREEYEFFKGA